MGKTQKRIAKRAGQAKAAKEGGAGGGEAVAVAVKPPMPLAARVAQITSALQEQKRQSAVHYLRELCEAGQKPRLGSLQRWVRLVDSSLLEMDSHGLLVLRALLCVPASDPVSLAPVCVRSEVVQFAPRLGPAPTTQGAPFTRTLVAELPGVERLPPNKHPLQIFAPEDAEFPEEAATPERVDLDGGVVAVTGALSAAECGALHACADQLGYALDEPLRADAPAVPSKACVWMCPPLLLARLTERLRVGLPPVLAQDGEELPLLGINARFRSYRYDPGFTYRPHLDGAWPGSGLDAAGKYQYDAFGDRRSRVTIVFYLNDDFEGGHTTFYSQAGDAILARKVQPSRGSALLFPHGDLRAPVHEGSAVTSGAKLIVRTEALYATPARKRRQGAEGDAKRHHEEAESEAAK